MADEQDLASDREEIARQSAQVTSRRPSGPEPTGYCHYCGDRIPKPMRWCDAECRNEWSSLNE